MSKEIKNKRRNPLLETDASGEEILEEKVKEATEQEEVYNEPAPVQTKGEFKPEAKGKSINIDTALMSDAKRTKQITDNEEQIMFMVPLAQGETAGATHECFINGQKYVVRKGEMIKLPKSVVNLLAEHYNVELNAGADMLIHGDIDRERALR
jgi:hypothetical protein